MKRLLLLCPLAACGRHEAGPKPVTGQQPSPTVGHWTKVSVPCPADAELGEGFVTERRPIAATPAAGGAPCLDAVRADLGQFRLRVLTSRDGASRGAPAWLEQLRMSAIINAGMFHETGAPVGLIVEDGIAIGSDNKQMSGFLAFDPISPTDPAAIVAGRNCAGFDLADLHARYRSIVQSYRLHGCEGTAIVWSDAKQYSAAAIGVDRRGRVVFIHARAAVTMSELATAVATLDCSSKVAPKRRSSCAVTRESSRALAATRQTSSRTTATPHSGRYRT